MAARSGRGAAMPGGPASATAMPHLLMTASNRGLGCSQASESLAMVVVAARRAAARLQRARSAGPGHRATAMPVFAGRSSVIRVAQAHSSIRGHGKPGFTEFGTGRSQSSPLKRASVNARLSSLSSQGERS